METKVKKNYTKPTLMSEVFVPQEYCASCKDAAGITTYSASCDTSGYVFEDTNMNGVFDNGTDKYMGKNNAGSSCNFTIDYYPGEKNAFIFTSDNYIEYDGIDGFFTQSLKVKEGYESYAIHGYRIIENEGTFSEDSHFIANLSSTTIKPNLS